MRTIVLDAPVLGLVTNPKASPENTACREWLDRLLEANCQVVVPEIADYEVRRELIRAQKTAGLARLDSFTAALEYLPLTTAMVRHAAELWALARQQGHPTSDPKALDGDVILSAQALSLGVPTEALTVATTNVGHLELFVPAAEWRRVTP